MKPVKLDPSDTYQQFDWVAHPNGGPDDLVARRYDIEIFGGVSDQDACYSYDDWALCRLDGQFYLFATSGCSCPSPTETWRVEIGPCSLDNIRQHLLNGKYEGYTVPGAQMAEFLALINEAELYVKNEASK